jgi:hypothetical protein
MRFWVVNRKAQKGHGGRGEYEGEKLSFLGVLRRLCYDPAL